MDTSKKIFSLILLVITVRLYSLTPDQIYSNLNKTYKKIKSFSADFEQFNYWSEIEDSLFSKGKIYYNQNKLLLNYTKPSKQIVLLDTLKITIWDIEKKQAIITNNNTDIAKPIDIIRRYWYNSEKNITKKDDILKIKLITEYQTIFVLLRNYIITELKITSKDGNIVKYKFKNIKINPVLKEEIFDIKLPNDVKIIQN